MIGVLQDAVKLTNYQGELTHSHKNAQNFDGTTILASDIVSTEYYVRNAEGTLASYTS